MAAPYLLKLDRTLSGLQLLNGVDTMVVYAESAADAKLAANRYVGNDARGMWSNATATDLSSAPAVTWEGFTFRVQIGIAGDLDEQVDVSYVGTSANNTIDEIAAQLVTLLNATTPVSNASYDSATNILTAAAIADGLGDKVLTVTVTDSLGQAVAGAVGAIVDEGIAGAVLTAALAADTYIGTPSVAFIGGQ